MKRLKIEKRELEVTGPNTRKDPELDPGAKGRLRNTEVEKHENKKKK